MDVQTAVAVAVPVVGVIVWLVRLEAGVTANNKAHDEFKAEVRDDLKYIRQRLDRVLNGRHE